jgi:Nitrate and nitrite sensing
MRQRSHQTSKSIGRDDATRIVRFCLAGVGWGSALHEDDLCVVKIARSGAVGSEIMRFEAVSFEAALRQAADAGALKSLCLEKQIAFLARVLPTDDSRSSGEAPGARPGLNGSPETLFSALTAAISALVHETQRERGTSSLYLSSGGRLFARELRGQWRITDARREELVRLRDWHASRLPRILALHLERAEALLGGLAASRGAVELLQATPASVIDRYSNVNGELLSVIDALEKGVEIALRPTALAWMALLYAKEKTGIERAQLANAFSLDHYVDGQHATVSALIAACDSYLHVFAAAAPDAFRELLRDKMQSDVAISVTAMERVALMKRDGGFGIDPTLWFANVSRKMDLLGNVELAVRSSISNTIPFPTTTRLGFRIRDIDENHSRPSVSSRSRGRQMSVTSSVHRATRAPLLH